MSWLGKIVSFITSLFSAKTGNAILAGIKSAAPYVSTALELSSIVAGIIGGPTGATITAVLAVADRFGVQTFIKPGATDLEIKTALRDATVAALRLKFPNASTAQLNLAVEMAVGAVKSVPPGTVLN